MRKINLGFRKYSEANLLALAQAIAAALTGNFFFPTPVPTLAAFQTAIDNYSSALAAAADGGKSAIAAKDFRKEELIALLIQLANYIMLTANGNYEMLASTAFPLSRPKEPLPLWLSRKLLRWKMA